MSITSRINEMSTHIEQAYDELQGLGADLTNVNKNIENISSVLDDIYDSLPSVSGEGTSLTLDDTRVGKIKSTLKGNTSQDGTPTPDSPIPVNVVSGDNEINVVGKNLFQPYIHTDRGITSEFVNGEIHVYGTATSQFNFALMNDTIFNGTYTFSVSGTIPTSLWFWNKTTSHTDVTLPVNGTRSFTYDSNNTLIGAFTATNGTSYDFTIKPMIEKGSSASTYEPYQGNTYNIDLPVENLFDKSIATTGKGVNVNTGALYNETATFATDYIEIQNNATYIPSGYSSSVNRVYGAIYDSDKSYLEGISTDIGTKKFTISNANAKYIRLTGFVSEIDTWQLEKGSKQNNFTPYGTTPIELCKIGNYQDYIYKDSDKWYLHKEIGSKDFTSTNMTMNYLNVYDDYRRLMITKTTIGIPTGWVSGLALCNYFKELSGSTPISIGTFNTDKDSANLFVYLPTTINTLAEAKTYMDSLTNSKIYYVLATPTNTEITDTNLLSQLNALELAQSKENQTNISQVNNDLPFIISASALKEWSV